VRASAWEASEIKLFSADEQQPAKTLPIKPLAAEQPTETLPSSVDSELSTASLSQASPAEPEKAPQVVYPSLLEGATGQAESGTDDHEVVLSLRRQLKEKDAELAEDQEKIRVLTQKAQSRGDREKTPSVEEPEEAAPKTQQAAQLSPDLDSSAAPQVSPERETPQEAAPLPAHMPKHSPSGTFLAWLGVTKKAPAPKVDDNPYMSVFKD